MRTKAGIAGRIVTGLLALAPVAYSSPYASMAVPGTHNDWDTAPSMVLVGGAGNVWVCTQSLSAASGEFKFAADNGWTTSWGGGASVARVPAAASAPDLGGVNLTYSGLTPGNYRFTFNDSTLQYWMEWAGASPLPIPVFANLALVGDFNGWTPNANSALTNHPAPATNLWSGSIDLESATAFRFQPDGSSSNEWGAPASATLSIPAAGASACGKSSYTLSGFEPGTFRFELDVSNAAFSVSQTYTQEYAITTMTVQGDFIATENLPANMTQLGGTTVWESDHHVTNASPLTLRFMANHGVKRWGVTNGTPAFAQPASGTLTAGETNYVQMTVDGVSSGRYRATFNHLTGEFTFRRQYVDDSLGTNVNLLKNPGFEITSQADGGNAIDWGSWQAWPKNVANHGYRPHSGSWCGAIHGKLYPEWTDYGSFSQDVAIESGKTYRAAAWFRADTNWSATSMQIKMEWRDSAGAIVGTEDIAEISSLTTNWTKHSLEGTAPAGAVTNHLVFLCSGADTLGTMQVDDAELRVAAGRTQNFDTWGALADFAYYAPDWSVSSGKTTNNVPPGRPPAQVFISQYVEGTGNNKAIEIYNGTLSNLDLAAGGYVLRQYDNGATSPSATIALSGTLDSGECLVVARPGTPPAYAPDADIADVADVLTNKLTFNGDDVVVLLRGSTVLDRVGQVGTNASSSLWSLNAKNRTLTRRQTIFTGTVTAVDAAFPMDEWELSDNDTFDGLGIHDVSYVDPNEPYTPSGLSLIMDAGAILMSGELPGGIGDVSFWYRTESMVPPVDISIESAASEDGPWTTNDTLAGIAASNFAYYAVAINRADHSWIRFRQTDGGTNRFRIDEITVAEPSAIRRTEDFTSWTDPSYALPGNHTRNGWSIQAASIATGGVLNSRAALLTPTNSQVISPAFEGGVGETRFWAKALNSGTTAYLLLQTATDGSNWTTQASFTVTTGKTFSAWLYLTDDNTQARIVFDPAQASDDVLVDSVEIRLPELYRNQNFDGWPTTKSYVSESFQGWIVSNCYVNSDNAYAGQVARLNTAVGNYVRSPEMPDGLGTLSFRYRKWSSTDAAFTLQVQVSSNAVSWTTLASVSASSTNYQQFTWFLQDTTNRYLRLYHSAGAVRVLIDDIRIGEQQPRPTVLVAPGLDPANPLIDDPISLVADVVARYGASILSVTGYYSVASTTNPLSMAAVDYGTYESTSDIPGQPAGTRIRYFVKVRYAGVGAATNSTGYTTNTYTTPIYTNFVSAVPQGSVWINEFFFMAYGTDEPWIFDWETFELKVTGENHEFIELAGLEGSDIGGWSLELAFGSDADIALNGGQPVYASYKIPTNTVFTNQTNGFSFYVLGDAQLATNQPVNQILATHVSTNVDASSVLYSNHIYNGVGVIRLVNQYSNVVYSLSYGGYAPNSEHVEQSQSDGETNSIGLAGTGSSYGDFDWEKGEFTIGEANDGQTLEEPPPDTNSYAYAWHSQGLKITPANTNLVAPFYMLDPLAAAHWDVVSVYYGYTNAEYASPAGTLYHRLGGTYAWSNLVMEIRVGALDANGHGYVYAQIPARAYRRLQTIQYVVEIDANESGVANAFLGSGPASNNVSTVYTNFDDAAASPFSYLVPIGDAIYVSNFVAGATSLVIRTGGNDFYDPITNFTVKFTTNLMVSTNAWLTTNVLSATRDIYSNYSFTVRRSTSIWPKAYYRVDPRWP